MTDREFWALTLAQYSALSRQLELKREREEFGPALIASTLCNINRSPKSPTFKIDDFMPSRSKRERRQTPEQMLEFVKLIQPILGGTLTSGG